MIPNSLGDPEGIDKDKLNFPLNDARDIDILFPGAFDHSLDFNEVFRASTFEPNGFISDTSILDSTTLFPPQFADTSNAIEDSQGDFDFLNETYPNDSPPVKIESTPAPVPTPLLPILSQQPEMLPSEAPKSKKKSRKGTQKKNTKEKARKRKQKVAENIEDPAKEVNDDSMREQKRQERLMRNRASAQLSRERKKRYMKQLESQLKDLTAANANLSSQVIRLTVENNKLKDHIRRLDLQRPFATIMSPPHSTDSSSPDSEISEISQSPPISDPDSPLGLPLSPSSQSGSESNGPPAKRARIGQGKTIGTGVMFLAFVVSFGIFCALVGIIPEGHPGMIGSRDSTYVLRGRSLQNFDDTQALVDFPQLPSTLIPPSTSASPPLSSSPTVVVIPPTSDSAPLTPGAKEKLAMVSLLSLSEGRSNTDQDGRALDIYSEPAVEQKSAPSMDELLAAYKKILLSSNFSLEMGASYLFCPSPVQIQSNLFPSRPSLALSGTNDSTSTSIRVETKDSQRRAKRLRRAGLSDIASANKRQRTNESDVIAQTTTVSGDSPQRLNLWVPTTSLFPHWAHLLPSDQEENPRKVSGLSEINCIISSIRPVMLS